MAGIETSQHVQLNYEIAGVGERVLAFVLDAFFLGVYIFVVTMSLGYLENFLGDSLLDQQWVPVALVALPVMLYHLVIETLWNGYSLGKKIVSIRVVKLDGSRADISGYFLRWIMRLVEITMTSGVLAFTVILVNGKGQRLGDIVAKTCVIKERKKVKLDETLYSDIDQSYEPVYQEVIELTDKDISIIRKVIDARGDYDQNAWFVMLQRTAGKVERKLQIQRGEQNALDFLETLIKDYNVLHGE